MLLEENQLDYREKLRLYHNERYMLLREHDPEGLERAEVYVKFTIDSCEKATL